MGDMAVVGCKLRKRSSVRHEALNSLMKPYVIEKDVPFLMVISENIL